MPAGKLLPDPWLLLLSVFRNLRKIRVLNALVVHMLLFVAKLCCADYLVKSWHFVQLDHRRWMVWVPRLGDAMHVSAGDLVCQNLPLLGSLCLWIQRRGECKKRGMNTLLAEAALHRKYAV